MSATEEAFRHVRVFDEFPSVDNQPPIEAPSVFLQYQYKNNLNFVDVNAYTHERFSYYNDEMKQIAKLNENLKNGDSFLSFLYSYRSLAKAIPQVSEQDTTNRAELYEKTMEVLQPQVARMKQLMGFCDTATELVINVIKVITEIRKKEKIIVSEEFLLALAKNLNMFIVLDALKNMKSSLNNDNAMYKRSLSNMKKTAQSGKDETTENQKLYMFLANRDSFTTALKTFYDQQIKDDETLEDLVNTCSDLLEAKAYVYPESKHILLKAMAFGVFLLDRDLGDKNALIKNKKSLDRVSKLVKATPVVPLFGDVSTSLESILKRAKTPEASRWTADSNDDSLKKNYSVLASLNEVKEQFKSYCSEFGVIMNETRSYKNDGDLPTSQTKNLYNLVLRGFILAADVTRRVNEQCAWKFDKPTDPYVNPECPQDASDYEKVVRYNYNSHERFALIEFIAIIKSLNSMLKGVDADFGDVLRKHVHDDVQHFIQVTLAEIINHVSKKKKPSLNLLLHVKEIGGDFLEGYDASTASKDKKKKKLKEEPSGLEAQQPFPSRNAGIAASQLAYIRALLDAAFNEKAPGMKGGFMKDTDFNSSEVTELSNFFRNSFYYPYVLNLSETLERCCDLSELWYKEFYLEISKQIQFPIEMSLPWILTDHILTVEAPEMTENILFPLDLYNDAAHRALHKLKTRYLFDEIEAEVNLAFDQFIFKLAQNIFTHYKCWASSLMINKGYKIILEENPATEFRFDPPKNRYKTLLQQRHFQLLGRSVDIGKLLGQRMIQYLKKSLDTAIQRFEGSDLTEILELEALVEHNRITHQLLSQHVELGNYDDLLTEIDEAVSFSLGGRILAHTMNEIREDINPSFCFNSVTGRFIRPPFSLNSSAPQRPQKPRGQPIYMFGNKYFNAAFLGVFELNKGFFGEIHIRALISLIGRKSLPLLVGELSKTIEDLFKQFLNPYVQALIRGFPVSTKLPQFLYKTVGGYEYFYAKLKPLLTYRDLKTEVFQSFREFGNALCFVSQLDKVLEQDNVMNIVLTAPFLGIVSSTSETPPDELFTMKQEMAKAKDLLSASGTKVDFTKFGETVDKLYRPGNLSYPLLCLLIEEVDKLLNDVRGEWRGSVPSNEVIEVDYCLEFYRIWSAIQFSICTPPFNPTEYTTRELFGEGLPWAGCTIIFLLDQVQRFNVFDFSYHLANVASYEKEALPVASGVDLSKFVELTNFYKSINDEIFLFLELVKGKKTKQSGKFVPPTIDNPDGSYQSYSGEHGTAKRVVTEKKLAAGAQNHF